MMALVRGVAVKLPTHGQAFAARQMHTAIGASHHVIRNGFILLRCDFAITTAAQIGAHNPVHHQDASD